MLDLLGLVRTSADPLSTTGVVDSGAQREGWLSGIPAEQGPAEQAERWASKIIFPTNIFFVQETRSAAALSSTVKMAEEFGGKSKKQNQGQGWYATCKKTYNKTERMCGCLPHNVEYTVRTPSTDGRYAILHDDSPSYDTRMRETLHIPKKN